MLTLNLQSNPFKVFTPEDMGAADVHALFVAPFTDFNKILEPGHTMINGPRGCGKSMIFRYLLPDCQCLASSKPMDQLPFLAFLISIKNSAPNLTEFRRLYNLHADIVLNEHVLTLFVATKIFESISRFDILSDEKRFLETDDFLNNIFIPRLTDCGGNIDNLNSDRSTVQDIFHIIRDTCSRLYVEISQYARRLAFSNSAVPYKSALFGYIDFLYPILNGLKSLSFFPSSPIYLLIDDADYLSKTQTVVLNSWISTRTQADVSIKVSTQLRFKTFATISGLPIQSPHDYQAIDIADIYTTNRGRYLSRTKEIIKRRLDNADIKATPEVFFPCDQQQEDAIQQISRTIRDEWKEKGRGYRPSDDVSRYARPRYIRSLSGQSKSLPSYSYSGFEQLVHISSGLVRYFLEAAAIMFDDQQSTNPESPVAFVSPAIQNRVIRAEADNLMLSAFERIRREEEGDVDNIERNGNNVRLQMDKLYSLISFLGGVFFLKLISNDAERRVFSVAISGKSDPEINEIFDLGVRYGYFHRSSIGNKDGTGRTQLYVLTRRLAPCFKLDPMTFAGYLWITADFLRKAIENPDTILRNMKIQSDWNSLEVETEQLTLFD